MERRTPVPLLLTFLQCSPSLLASRSWIARRNFVRPVTTTSSHVPTRRKVARAPAADLGLDPSALHTSSQSSLDSDANPLLTSSPHKHNVKVVPSTQQASGPKKDSVTPPPLTRPVGLAHPPRPGENTGEDTRSWRQRREDFIDRDKHSERRKHL